MAEYSFVLKKYFVASHIHNGEDIHGHNFYCIGEFELDKVEKVKKEFDKTLKLLDYRILNEIDFFKEKTPSTENIALFIYQNLKDKIKVKKIEVFETVNFSGGVK
ncbi:6-pyruvoyltetrahydropterin/6-carboxytetrahydropterin synthase [Thermotomaculum hydrothermale]|uniref:6-carboxy-5,6,7,8-tetrahydropterin synthase n=1 Tax=Thermotomaculum hydrothermale TaxID=981385 RepID=A0A7R6PU69_9BACT|nr:6-carboxytetrahydropterin synthase [Thermotomaculum hydrothermale]BBB32742.1 6-pyruvoyltetrahydropterin/6-carboxytetrahydropterin synthase [Thermotomaculum hydrothermale]